ncbi:hypothetical protein VA7868_03532 [Vibrio aerogenes CECT 7868]|uniref:Uncharacterized protein n=1 Tax=Vibrio aerogenes CECT 7868 TaxID=1216006 RepID=A0A1M6ABI6_9VIBR|nr:hypothetical protein [Vibrio aerogenes]SHI33738.1 hypothetical protein VA7868_03532 [Vibrio aerogenes CECT 7868]
MSWLNYITLNAVAPVPELHQISDAGEGAGLMQLHPTRDTEQIACGHANTRLNGEYRPSPVTGNGLVTPAILVHGLFQALRKKGFRIRLHCYQLGLDNTPDLTGCKLDEVVVHHCQTGEEARLMQDELIPELKRQAEAGEAHLIAESGIGGTTFATLWLRRWLDLSLWFSGSTTDPQKLAIKSRLLESLWNQSSGLPSDVNCFRQDHGLSDPVQRACCTLLETALPSLNLAGGVMMFAPVIAMHGHTAVKELSLLTTKWVLDSRDARIAAASLPDNCIFTTSKASFLHSQYPAIRMYEQGYIIEGCGLGACLVFAEQHGLSEQEIIDSLDRAVGHWLA